MPLKTPNSSSKSGGKSKGKAVTPARGKGENKPAPKKKTAPISRSPEPAYLSWWENLTPERKLDVVVGDAGKTEDLIEVCKDADALVIESTYLDEEAEMARQFSHLTARQGAELAIKAGAKKLILTHISRRYREKDVLKEAQAIFPNTSVARDFDSFQIKREE